MKAAVLFTGTGPLAVLTSCDDLESPVLLDHLHTKGIDKFMAFELPLDEVRSRYGYQFTEAVQDLHQKDVLRVLDADGGRIFRLFRFDEFGQPVAHEAGRA